MPLTHKNKKHRPVETAGCGRGRGSVAAPSKIFAKFNLLPVDYDSEKITTIIQTSSNFLKTTGNIFLVYFMYCIKLTFINIASLILYLFIFYHDDYHFEKQSFIKPCLFQ